MYSSPLQKPEPKKSPTSVSSSATKTPVVSSSPSPVYHAVHVNERRTQRLIDPGSSVEKPYSWDSKFSIYVHTAPKPWVQVVVVIDTAATEHIFNAWSQNIKDAWNGTFAITDRKTGTVYPVTAQIVRSSKERPAHYTVDVVNQEKALGIRGLMGTEHMTKWGAHDPQDIPHEFSHMLGNKDEYGTVDDVDWSAKRDIHDPSTQSIMFKGDEPVRARHFDLIAEKVKTVLGDDVEVTKTVSQPSSVSSVSSVKMPSLMQMLPVAPKQTLTSSTSSKPLKSSSVSTQSLGSTPTIVSKSVSSTPTVGSKSVSSSLSSPVKKGSTPSVSSLKTTPTTSSSYSSLSGGHEARVQAITDYLLADKPITKEQEDWLSKNAWSTSPMKSDIAMSMLRINL